MSSPKLVKSSPSGILPMNSPISGNDKLVKNAISISIDAEHPKNTNIKVIVPTVGLQFYKLRTFLVKDPQNQKTMLSASSLDYA